MQRRNFLKGLAILPLLTAGCFLPPGQNRLIGFHLKKYPKAIVYGGFDVERKADWWISKASSELKKEDVFIFRTSKNEYFEENGHKILIARTDAEYNVMAAEFIHCQHCQKPLSGYRS